MDEMIETVKNGYNGFLINLDRREDRLQQANEVIDKTGIHIERVSAIDGAELEITDQLKARINPWNLNKRNISNPKKLGGILGCCLSHLSVWEKISRMTDEYVFVFEDDVAFYHKDFNSTYPRVSPDIYHYRTENLIKEKNIKNEKQLMEILIDRSLKFLKENPFDVIEGVFKKVYVITLSPFKDTRQRIDDANPIRFSNFPNKTLFNLSLIFLFINIFSKGGSFTEKKIDYYYLKKINYFHLQLCLMFQEKKMTHKVYFFE